MSQQDNSHTTVFGADATPRPIRVAFIVNTAQCTHRFLDELLLKCMTVWGGRYHPIVLTDGHVLAAGWRSLLVSIDPDALVFAGAIDDTLIRELRLLLHPTTVDAGSISDYGLGSAGQFGALSNVSLPFAIASEYRGEAQPTFLLPEWSRSTPEPHQRFVLSNFGARSNDQDTRSAYRSVTTQRLKILTEGHVKTLLRDLRSSIGDLIYLPCDLAQTRCEPPCTFRDARLHNPLLVIGDTIEDRVYAWNHGLIRLCERPQPFARNWPRHGNVWWLDSNLATEREFLALCLSCVKRFHVQYPADLVIDLLSCSLDADRVKAIARQVESVSTGTLPCRVAQYHAISFHEVPAPVVEEYFDSADVPSKPFIDGQCRLAIEPPRWVGPDELQDEWMMDIAQTYPLVPNENVVPPPRLRIPRDLVLAYRIVQSPGQGVRVLSSGRISAHVHAGQSHITVRLVDPSDLLLYRAEVKFEITEEHVVHMTKTGLQVDGLSADGKRLAGLIRVFGGHGNAVHFFAHPFWRDAFAVLCQGRGDALIKAVSDVLATKLSDEALRDREKAIQAASRAVVNRLAEESDSGFVVSADSLRSKYHRWRNKELGPTNDQNDKRELDLAYRDELRELARLGVLAKGVQSQCATCGANSWRNIRELDESAGCEVCGTPLVVADDTLPIYYRLSGYVAAAITSSGVLPVLQTIEALRHPHRHALLYAPSLDVRLLGAADRLTDIDLVFVSNGRLGVAEVKSSAYGFAEFDVAPMVNVCKRMAVDWVVLAAPESVEWQPVESCAAKLRSELAAGNIVVSHTQLDWMKPGEFVRA